MPLAGADPGGNCSSLPTFGPCPAPRSGNGEPSLLLLERPKPRKTDATDTAALEYPCRAVASPSPILDASRSPNTWRATELHEAVSHRRKPPFAAANDDGGAEGRAGPGGRTLLVPLHLLTAPMFDAHVGIGRDGRQADCTHWCAGPFVWEPLWWALRMAVTASLT